MACNAADFVQHVTAALPHRVKFQTHSHTSVFVVVVFCFCWLPLSEFATYNIAIFILFLPRRRTHTHMHKQFEACRYAAGIVLHIIVQATTPFIIIVCPSDCKAVGRRVCSICCILLLVILLFLLLLWHGAYQKLPTRKVQPGVLSLWLSKWQATRRAALTGLCHCVGSI